MLCGLDPFGDLSGTYPLQTCFACCPCWREQCVGVCLFRVLTVGVDGIEICAGQLPARDPCLQPNYDHPLYANP